jgi:hypothetical protein
VASREGIVEHRTIAGVVEDRPPEGADDLLDGIVVDEEIDLTD